MRAPAPLPLRAPGLGRRLTLVTRRVASAGEQPSHAARPGHAVRHPGCGNRERERSLPVTCNKRTIFLLQPLSSFFHFPSFPNLELELTIYANNPRRIEAIERKFEIRSAALGSIIYVFFDPRVFRIYIYIYVERIGVYEIVHDRLANWCSFLVTQTTHGRREVI